jgi:hypothetical protein
MQTAVYREPEKLMNYPAASCEVSTGKIRSKDEASFGELNPHWGLKCESSPKELMILKGFKGSRV